MDKIATVKAHFHNNQELYGFATYAIGTVAISIGTRKLIEKAFVSYIDAHAH